MKLGVISDTHGSLVSWNKAMESTFSNEINDEQKIDIANRWKINLFISLGIEIPKRD